MQKQRLIFMEGAKKNNVDETIAANIFDLMESLLVMDLINRIPQLMH